MDYTGDIVISEYYADEGGITYKVNGIWETVTDINIYCSGSIIFTHDALLESNGGNLRNVIWSSPKIYMNTTVDWGFAIRNNEANSVTFNNSSVNFDNTVYDTDPNYIGRIFFTGTSSLNLTANSNGKTLIKASTLSGTITLDVEEGVQDGDTFSIEATDNQLVITDDEWTATPSTVGNVTTYTLAKAGPSKKQRLFYTYENGNRVLRFLRSGW